MKTILFSLFLVAATSMFAADKISLYQKGDITVETFTGMTTPDFKNYDGLYGIGVSYAYHANWTVGGRILHHGFDIAGPFVEDVQGRITGRLPLKGGHLAPYLYVGAGARLQGRQAMHLDSGAGLEYRFTRHLGAFAETGWQANFAGGNSFVGTGGLRWRF